MKNKHTNLDHEITGDYYPEQPTPWYIWLSGFFAIVIALVVITAIYDLHNPEGVTDLFAGIVAKFR